MVELLAWRMDKLVIDKIARPLPGECNHLGPVRPYMLIVQLGIAVPV